MENSCNCLLISFIVTTIFHLTLTYCIENRGVNAKWFHLLLDSKAFETFSLLTPQNNQYSQNKLLCMKASPKLLTVIHSLTDLHIPLSIFLSKIQNLKVI